MKSASSCFALCVAMMLGCKGGNFTDKSANVTTAASQEAARVETIAAEENDDEVTEVIALEPTSVGGAFLGCFADPQIEADLLKDINPGADTIAVGCQAFDDANFSHVLGRGTLVMENVAVQAQNRAFATLDNHPRWAWLTSVPRGSFQSQLSISVRARADAVPVQLRVELLDTLPASIALGPLALSQGTYKLRAKNSGLCLDGNAAWDFDNVAGRPVTESLRLVDCETALSFRFSSFQSGWRLHVPHPAPPSCDLSNTPVAYCGQSCIDLENFGLGPRFVLWACTTSVEAQNYVLTSANRGAVRMQANGRFINLKETTIFPDMEAGLEFDIVPSPIAQ
jgi:hypothetical protein